MNSKNAADNTLYSSNDGAATGPLNGFWSEDDLNIFLHEFMTPMTLSFFSLDMLKKALKDHKDKNVHNYLNILNFNFHRVNKLTKRFSDVVSIETPGNEPEMCIIDLVEFLENLCQNIPRAAEGAKAKIKFETSCKFANIKADINYLESIFLNLISNAFKHTKDSARDIIVQIFQESDSYAVEVKDFGIGIKRENLENIFDKFFRCSSDLSVSGLGLGLYIVKSFSDKMSARVEVKSAYQKSSSFFVYFPKIEGDSSQTVYQPLSGYGDKVASSISNSIVTEFSDIF